MEETRKRLGKAFAQGKTKYYEQHYLEFKDEIDKELNPVEEPKEETKSKKEK